MRSVLPRIDVERVCFWEVPFGISTALVGRTLATLAEVSYGILVSRAVASLATDAGYKGLAKLAHVFAPAVTIANCFCWFAVTTTRQYWHAVEESIWAAGVGLIVLPVCTAVLLTVWGRKDTESAQARRFLLAAIAFGLVYVAYMVAVDVPMVREVLGARATHCTALSLILCRGPCFSLQYMRRWRENGATQGAYFTVPQGVADAATCRSVSRSWAVWREEVPWMTGYFTVGVWTALAMVTPPRLTAAASKRAS